MKIRIYNDSEIENFKNNIYVIDVLHKRTIIYDPAFKLWAIMTRMYHPELSAKEIFKTAGFDINVLNDRTPQERIRQWMMNYKKYGVKYFLPEDKAYYSLPKVIKKYKKENYNRNQFVESVIRLLEEYEQN